jgi:hypothetical protein
MLDLGTVITLNAYWRQVIADEEPLALLNELGLNVTSSDSTAVGALVVRNDVRGGVQHGVQDDVRGGVQASIDNAQVVAGGTVSVTATESAAIRAVNESTVTSEGGSLVISGRSIAVNAVIATNLVLSMAHACVTDSDLTTNNGDVVVEAANSSAIDARIRSDTTSNGVSVGVTLAFNTIGWDAQNFLFNTVDALLSTGIGTEIPAEAKASIERSEVDAAGAIRITTTSDARVDAEIASSSTAIKATFTGPTSVSVGAIIAMNKSSTLVHSVIDGSTGIVIGGDLHVTADDNSIITADAQAASVAASLTGSTGTAVSIGLSLAHNTIDNDVAAAIKNAGSVTTGGSDVIVRATSDATVEVSSVAVSVGIAAGSTGFALSGGGAESTNVILSTTNASIEDSVLGSSANPIGNVDVDAASTSRIDATVGAVAASAALGSTTGVGVALGVAVARNFIGWDPSGGDSLSTTYTTEQDATTLVAGQTVRIAEGARTGDVYEYLGPTLTDGDPNTEGIQAIDLATQNFHDGSLWKQLGLLSSSPGQVQAFLDETSIHASGALTLDAIASQSIDAIVVAGAAALSGGGTTGVAVSGAGVYAENKINFDVKASILGDGADGICAGSVSLRADDGSGISAIAGAASLAASVAGTTGVSVSIGLSIAFNELSGDVAASIQGADQGVTTTSGDVTLSATSHGQALFDLDLNSLPFSAADLDDAATADRNDPDTPANEAILDAAADMVILGHLRAAFAAQGQTLAMDDTVATASMYTTEDGVQDLHEGNTVKLAAGYGGGGLAGRVYRYIGSDRYNVNLGVEDYGTTSNWLLLDKLKISTLVEGSSWAVVAPDGATFILIKDGETINVSRSTINVVSAAASFAAGFGGTAGVAFSGAGAVAQNVVLTCTNAFVDSSQVSSAGDVAISAASDSMITATVAAASVAMGGGGTAGVGVSIGIAVARNFIGWPPDGSDPRGEVQAYIRDSSVLAADDLVLTALASQTINSVVLAGSAAVAAGGTAGVGVSGSGVYAENKIRIDVKAFIDGDGPIGGGVTEGILADHVTLTALDSSTISALAGAASLAASLGGTASVSVSVGVSLAENTISSEVAAYIANADDVTATGGNIILEAIEKATITTQSIAAAVSLAAGGTFGLALSGGGAEATNIILTRTNAYVESSRLSSQGNVLLSAENTSTITATVVGVSGSVAVGGTVGAAASIGAAVASNLIGWNTDGKDVPAQVQAYLLNSSIDAQRQSLPPGTVRPNHHRRRRCRFGRDWRWRSRGGRLERGGGQRAEQGGHAGPGLHRRGRRRGIAAACITLTANDGSTITTDVGAASVAGSVGGAAAVSASIGIALACNEISNQVETFIVNADTGVTSREGGIWLSASETATIDATSVAASLAAAFSGGGSVALSGAGADAVNIINNTVRAAIADSSVTTESDFSIDLQADSNASITALVGAASAAVSGGVGAAAGAMGMSIARNLIGLNAVDDATGLRNQVLAYIDNSTVVSGGDVRISAASEDTVEAVSFAGSVAIAAGIGGAVAGSGAEATNRFSSKIHAQVLDSTVNAQGNVDVHANSDSQVTRASAVGAALSASLGAMSVAASVVHNDIRNDVQASISSTASALRDTAVDAGGNITITADVSRARIDNVSAVTASVSAGLVGMSGGGIEIRNVVANQVDARASGPVTLVADGDVQILAKENAFVSGDASAVTVSYSFGAALGAALVHNQLDSSITASVEGPSDTDRADVSSTNTHVRAESVANVDKTVSVGVSASALAAQGNASAADITTLVAAWTRNATLESSEDIVVKAEANNAARSNAAGGALGAIAAGAMIAQVNLGSSDRIDVEANVGDHTTVEARALRITAHSNDDLFAESTAAGGGAVAAAGAASTVTSNLDTRAAIGPAAIIQVDALVIQSTHEQHFDASADSFALALAAGQRRRGPEFHHQSSPRRHRHGRSCYGQHDPDPCEEPGDQESSARQQQPEVGFRQRGQCHPSAEQDPTRQQGRGHGRGRRPAGCAR